jgi:uncharacterized membrane protein
MNTIHLPILTQKMHLTTDGRRFAQIKRMLEAGGRRRLMPQTSILKRTVNHLFMKPFIFSDVCFISVYLRASAANCRIWVDRYSMVFGIIKTMEHGRAFCLLARMEGSSPSLTSDSETFQGG